MQDQNLKLRIHQLFVSNIELVVLVLFGILVAQTWFKEGYIMASSDYFPFIYQVETLKQSIFSWNYYDLGLGLPQYNVAYVIVLCFYAFFSTIGFSLPVMEGLRLTAWFVLPAVSMYLLSSIVLKGNRIARFAASFFYMINMFVVLDIWSIVAVWLYILIPFLLAILINAFESVSQNRKVLYHAVLFSVATMLTSYLSLNPAIIAVLLIALLSYIVFHLIFNCINNWERANIIKFLSVCGVLSIILNAWWIVPLHAVLFETPTSNPIKTSISDWWWTMARNQFVNVFRLNTLWSFIDYYYPYASVFSSNQLLIAASFAPSLLVFAALVFPDLRKNKYLVYAVLMLLPLLFLSKGVLPPFDGIYRWIYASVPFFWMFREPAYKFFPIIVGLYAVLIGFSVSQLCEKLKQILPKQPPAFSYSPLAVALLLFCIASYGIFTGEIVPAQRKDLPSVQVKIPNYWYEAAEFINSQPDEFRVLMLPKDEFYQIGYGWGYYGADLPPKYFFKKPAIVLINVGGYYTNYHSLEFITAMYDGIYEDENFPLAEALSMANIKYVVQRNDIDWTRFGHADLGSPEKIKGLMNGKKGVTLEKSIGQLDFYMNEQNSSQITAYAKAIYIMNGTISSMFYIQERTSVKQVFFLNGTNKEEQIIANKSNEKIICKEDSCRLAEIQAMTVAQPPKIKVTKYNPTSYEVSVREAYAPYWLVFSDSYDPGWALYDKGEKITEHYVANGYANGWRIEKTGDYTLTMEYEPQKKMYYAYMISLIALVLCVLYLIFRYTMQREKVVVG